MSWPDEKIVVSDDAENFAGDDVDGPFTAYSEAMVIKEHALEAGGGQTYAELPQDDPTRDTVMTASFLRASLFTSVVAFGVATLVAGLGVLFILLGLGFLGIVTRLDETRTRGRGAAGRIPHPAPQPDDATSSAVKRDGAVRRPNVGRPSEPRIVQRTNFVGPISGARADIISR